MLHLPILYMGERSQDLECTATALRVREAENQVGHERTLVVGDFNLDPFQYRHSGGIGVQCGGASGHGWPGKPHDPWRAIPILLQPDVEPLRR